MSEKENQLTRLNKFISETGICSRREADRLIEQGKVIINGKLAELGTKVSIADEIYVDGKLLNSKQAPVYLAFNKPVGITCTTDLKEHNNIIDFLKYPKRIFPIGRLDKASEGLIFLTNDGEIVNKILRAGNNHEKEYWVMVNKPVIEKFISEMANGVRILDTVTKKCFVKQQGDFGFIIILTQGLNRQIRRMCDALGYKVEKLRRVRIMNIDLSNLETGKWRYLTNLEISGIQNLLSSSSKTEEASYINHELEDE